MLRTISFSDTVMRFLRLAGIVGSILLAPELVLGQSATSEASRERNVERANEILASRELPVAGLLVEANLELISATATDRLKGRLSARITVPTRLNSGGPWAVTLVGTAVDEFPTIHHELLDGASAAGTRGFSYRAEILLPVDLQEAIVVVEETSTGAWGGTLAEWGEPVDVFSVEAKELPRIRPTQDSSTSPPASESPPKSPSESEYPTLGDRKLEPPRVRPAPRAAGQLVRLVPPVGDKLTGKKRFRTVTTTDAIRKVVFYLDGQEVAVDERAPFAAVLDLGRELAPHRVRIEAFGSADRQLGEDLVEINLDSRPFRVAITDVAALGQDRVRVVADVSLPPWEKLARVEFFRNESAVETLEGADRAAGGRFESMIESGGPTDFVRVVAHLVSGDTREDARLLSEVGAGERVEVNLVEIYAVVVDREGDPVRDLTRDRFRLQQGRREVEIERFALAEEVPLVLGLIIDSSESMFVQMVETRQAAARFVASTLKPQDRAFLVDFDTQPRLAQALTADVGRLMASLGSLRAGGATAIYDAAIFSLAQFEREPGRRALVLLTDGVDWGSRFGAKRGVEEARRLGVPLYVIAMSPETGQLGLTPGLFQHTAPIDLALEAFCEDTGGRLFKIQGMAELDRAYEQINAELRNQYLLTFSSTEPLSEAELRSIKVKVEGTGLSVRTVVLNR
ncbi:MAG: VWA domain-containing protein [Acidobacteriota bacterium]|nr:VWA domain-containing protein [Acidobacteriota bacterium]